jgi:hypothetical protein
MKFEEMYDRETQIILTDILSEIKAFAAQALSKEEIERKLKRNFSDEHIKLSYELYEKQYGVSSGGAVLRGKIAKDRLNWYSPVTEPDQNSRWGKLVRVLKGRDWNDEHIKDLDSQSNVVVANLASPKKVDPTVVKGLVLGYVQSGKTANFSAVIAKATDEGYRLVIVLSGVHNNLRSQTERRLQSELTDTFGGGRSFNLTSSDLNGDFKVEPTVSPNAILDVGDKFTLAVLKKNVSPLSKFTKWLSKASPEVLRKCPVLIIDDEADQASINEGKDSNTPTAINRRIRELIDTLRQTTTVSYCGYTATPFANVLIDANDEADLFPTDFIVSLRAPDSYVGTERLFGRAAVDDDGGSDGLDLVRQISPEELVADDDEFTGDLKPSLKRAIQSFLLAGAERYRRKQETKHMTMLVHTSHKIADHGDLTKKIQAYLKLIETKIELREAKTISDLNDLWEKDFKKTTSTFFPQQEMGSFETILECLDIFKPGPVIEENSVSETRLKFENQPAPVWAIIVGGNTLSRGLTIEGLTISYFQRNATAYDTLLQMGRWFGFRQGYLDLTRIFVTQEMESNFYHLATVEHELREDIYRMEQNGETPKDISMKIRDHDVLEITGRKVLRRNGVFATNSYSGQKIQATHLFLDNKDIADKNFAVIKTLLQELENKNLKVANEFDQFKRCHVYRSVNCKLILNFLKNYRFSEGDLKFRFNLLEPYITKLANFGELNDWSVALISANQADEKKLIDMEIDGVKAYAVQRRQANRIHPNARTHGTLAKDITILRDELIDMADLVPKTEMIEFLTDQKLSQAIRDRRNNRPQGRGLLLIYPIYTHWQLTPAERESIREGLVFSPIVSDIRKLFGITLVFPPTHQKHADVTYIGNVTVMNPT